MIRTALLLVTAGGLAAQDLNLLLPTGAARGQEVAVRCYGRGLKDVESVVWHRAGIEVREIVPERDDRVLLRLFVAADCELGTYLFALHTARGITRSKAFRVGPLPSVAEAREHGTRETAQRIDLGVTVDGRILPEQVDWYAFDVGAGQIVRAEAEGVRLGLYDLDLQIEVFDPSGAMILRSDDSALGRADPIAAFAAEAAGTYALAVRDVAWRGSSYGAYRLHVGTFARPVGLVPAGGRPGQEVEVTLVGDLAPAAATLTLPTRPGLHEVFPVVAGAGPVPTPVRVAVDDRPGFVEGEAPAGTPGPPCAFHGVIAAAGEEDRFAFAAKKGGRLEIRALARALRSPLDPVLVVRDEEGKALTSNDDGIGLDGRVRFTPPADGTYFACVFDHLRRGGPAYFYRLEVGTVPSAASTREAVPGRRAEDFGIAVPRGGRSATVIQVRGLDTRRGATLGFESLPAGVTVAPAGIPAGGSVVPVVFSAAPEAELGAGLATPTAVVGDEPAAIAHEHAFPILRVRNNQTYESRAVRALPVVVTEKMSFSVHADAPGVPLVRSGRLALPVRVDRADGFRGTVTVRALWLPPGVSASTMRLTGENRTGTVTFNANSRAALGSWPIVLTASAASGNVTRATSTDAMVFEVQEPWITAKLPRARIEQGAAGTFEVALERKREFDGEVTAELGRVPRGVTVAIPDITAPEAAAPEGAAPEGAAGPDTLPIALRAAADARPGRHRSIYLRLRIETPAGVIDHTVGGGELRVDEPLPRDLRAGGSR